MSIHILMIGSEMKLIESLKTACESLRKSFRVSVYTLNQENDCCSETDTPDVVVLALDWRTDDYLSILDRVREAYKSVPMIAFAQDYPKWLILALLKYKINAFLINTNPVQEFFTAIESVRDGKLYLTQSVMDKIISKLTQEDALIEDLTE